MAINYKIAKKLLPKSHYHYSSSGSIDLADVAEAVDSNLPSLDLTGKYKSSMKFASKTSMNNSWIKTVGGNEFKYGTGPSTSNFILKGSMPLFDKFHSITTAVDITSPIQLVWNRTDGIKIGGTTYKASDFRGGVVPNAIIVELQAGGGGGGACLSTAVQWTNGSGGGGGGHAVAVLELTENSSTWNICVGKGGAGGQKGASNHAADSGGTTMIWCTTSGAGTVRCMGGHGGAANNFQTANCGNGGSASVSGTYAHSLLTVSGGNGGKDANGAGVTQGTAYAFSNTSYNSKNINNKNFTAKSGGTKNGTAGGGGASRCGSGANATSSAGNSGSNGSGGSGGSQSWGDQPGGNGGNGFIYFYY